jgi:hypothetical protein
MGDAPDIAGDGVAVFIGHDKVASAGRLLIQPAACS